MRSRLSSVLLLAGLISGCATERSGYDEMWFWGRHSGLETDASAEALKASADDEAEARAVRSMSVFVLFANYIKPGANEKEICNVLRGSRWLESVAVYADSGNGMRTSYRAPDETVFRVHLFAKEGWSDWLIVCTVTARLTEAEFKQFLRGTLRDRNVRIREFILSFPTRKSERFTKGKVGLRCP